jgi:hypothetical protein
MEKMRRIHDSNTIFRLYLKVHMVILTYMLLPSNAVLAQDYMGYCYPMSIQQGSSANFFISCSIPGKSILHVYKEGDSRTFMGTFPFTSQEQAVPNNASEEGCNWNVSVSIPIPKSWGGGIYVACPSAPDTNPEIERDGIIFVVRESVPGSRSKILFQLATNTWHAYNNFGGKCLYPYRQVVNSNQAVDWVSYKRPLYSTDTNVSTPNAENFYERQGSRGGGERDFMRWLDRNNIAVEYCINTDVHSSGVTNLLSNYKLVLSVGHDEYWSWEMRDNLEKFVADGRNLAIFGANTCWWQIRYGEQTPTSFPDLSKIVCYKCNTISDDKQCRNLASGVTTLDPFFNLSGEEKRRTTVNWILPGAFNWNPINRPETHTIGISYYNGAITNPRNTGYTIREGNHWAYQDVAATNFGSNSSIVLIETNCVDFSDSTGGDESIFSNGGGETPANFQILASKLLKRAGTPGSPSVSDIAPYRPERTYAGAVMGLFNNNGIVFNVGTLYWAAGLRDNDLDVSKITRNVINKLSSDYKPEDLFLFNRIIQNGEKITYTSQKITAGKNNVRNYEVLNGDISFQASEKITLSPGFSALKGSKLVASVGSFNRTNSSSSGNKTFVKDEMKSKNKAEEKSIVLQQCYPNPFNPTTKIQFSLSMAGNVTLKVYDVLGRKVAELLNQDFMQPGNHEVIFNAKSLSSGVYFYKIESGNMAISKKMILLK